MPEWQRKPGDYVVKSAKMTDGEFLRLISGKAANADEQFDERIYSSLQTVKGHSQSALLWVLASSAFGVMSHFGVLKAASAGGLEVSPTIFSHAALLALSLSGAAFCFSYSKQTFIQCWFLANLRNATPAQKVVNLLKYPDAYWHLHFLPGTIGQPRYLVGRSRGLGQLLYVLLFLVAVIICGVGSLAIWFSVATDVWLSHGLARPVSVLTIALCTVVGLLGWASPFYYDWPRRYRHFGLATLFTGLQDDRLMKAHLKVFTAAQRMGLAKDDKAD